MGVVHSRRYRERLPGWDVPSREDSWRAGPRDEIAKQHPDKPDDKPRSENRSMTGRKDLRGRVTQAGVLAGGLMRTVINELSHSPPAVK